MPSLRSFTLVLSLIIASALATLSAQDDSADTRSAVADSPSAVAATPPEPQTIGASIDTFLGTYINGPIEQVLFFKIGPFPFLILVLVTGGLFFTIRLGFINIRLFKHAVDCVRGKYDNPNDEGEISHFRALTSALSATVGLGNIAGVAVAIAAGGPGAVFWMWIVAFFGMSMKLASCTMGQIYRRIDNDGTVLGGPMVYLEEGFKDRFPSMGAVGKGLGIFAAIATILASFGAGNLFQSKMTFEIANQVIGGDDSEAGKWAFGVVMAILVGLVIIGGIKRIGSVTSKLVPAMCVGYSIICLLLILVHVDQVPAMFSSIFVSAFNPDAAFGGFFGVLIVGVQRAAFSNEAGLGSASIAHSAAKTNEPVREGLVGMLGPFIDTIVVCTMTALAILITDVYTPGAKMGWTEGSVMTAAAFGTIHESLELFLIVAVFIFAYSTLISWSYYGERATRYLFGKAAIPVYRVVFTGLVVLGPVLSVGQIINLADLMLLSMAIPNILGMMMLSPVLGQKISDYRKRLNSGEMPFYEK